MFKLVHIPAAGALAGLALCLSLGTASAGPVPNVSIDLAQSAKTPMLEQVQYRGRAVRGGRVYGRGYGGGRRYGRGAVGAGIAAGVIGGLLGGALLAQPGYARPAPVIEEPEPVYVAPRRGGGSVEYCMSRYRSYDPSTGTYVGYDGVERPCP